MTKDSNPHHAARSSAASVPSALVLRYEAELKLVAEQRGPILDLACGRGRNGLHLAQQGAPVVFADNDATALEDIQQQLAAEALSKQYCRCWQVDLETEADAPLEHNEYSAIMVFRYLHRPLFGSIKQALVPGGLLVYETFTRDQAQYGRPNNPNFLLHPGELQREFKSWTFLHSFEGTVQNQSGHTQAIAQLVAVKPQ